MLIQARKIKTRRMSKMAAREKLKILTEEAPEITAMERVNIKQIRFKLIKTIMN